MVVGVVPWFFFAAPRIEKDPNPAVDVVGPIVRGDSTAAAAAGFCDVDLVIAAFRILTAGGGLALFAFTRLIGEPAPLPSPDARVLPVKGIDRLFRASFGELDRGDIFEPPCIGVAANIDASFPSPFRDIGVSLDWPAVLTLMRLSNDVDSVRCRFPARCWDGSLVVAAQLSAGEGKGSPKRAKSAFLSPVSAAGAGREITATGESLDARLSALRFPGF